MVDENIHSDILSYYKRVRRNKDIADTRNVFLTTSLFVISNNMWDMDLSEFWLILYT